LATACRSPLSSDEARVAAVASVLDDFHQAASKADGERYFSHFSHDAVFLGTDATEHWTVEEFRAWCAPYFARGTGWTYEAFERRIRLSSDARTAWFDERLSNEKYGEVRGSGVLTLDGSKWRIAQYVMSFPVPNELAPELLRLEREAQGSHP